MIFRYESLDEIFRKLLEILEIQFFLISEGIFRNPGDISERIHGVYKKVFYRHSWKTNSSGISRESSEGSWGFLNKFMEEYLELSMQDLLKEFFSKQSMEDLDEFLAIFLKDILESKATLV